MIIYWMIYEIVCKMEIEKSVSILKRLMVAVLNDNN